MWYDLTQAVFIPIPRPGVPRVGIDQVRSLVAKDVGQSGTLGPRKAAGFEYLVFDTAHRQVVPFVASARHHVETLSMSSASIANAEFKYTPTTVPVSLEGSSQHDKNKRSATRGQ